MTPSLNPSLPHFTVKCAGLGSLWWVRPGAQVRHMALINTTGFVFGSKDVHCYFDDKKTAGKVRFNCDRIPPITRFENEIGGVYSSEGVTRQGSENRLLLHPRIGDNRPIDCYLIAIDSAIHGLVDLNSTFFSGRAQLVSASQGRHLQQVVQQVLVLMWPGSSVTTTHGRMELSWIVEHQKSPKR